MALPQLRRGAGQCVAQRRRQLQRGGAIGIIVPCLKKMRRVARALGVILPGVCANAILTGVPQRLALILHALKSVSDTVVEQFVSSSSYEVATTNMSACDGETTQPTTTERSSTAPGDIASMARPPKRMPDSVANSA
eukprot:CAMPEP_0198540776 /NCGR_PEP_ID=MMETSP1462-20131121/53388_1 /TAXON_ID=1333877 /ORGANISM="Brandtodinium nutriculum, Strain RCC3387" /LENGTH=136 /DNA_ID=CAMNT_0044270903 /DNA_START=293 /DNA_END=704 /DNA_ORIENTATION=-